jgi:dihydroorotase-like cyclic amidohydrolase
MIKDYDAIIRGGTIVQSSGRIRADLAIRDGAVAAIGTDLGQATEEIDAGGLHVFPGLIDVHVHFREPGLDYKEDFATGTASAAVGGVTTVHDMPNTVPAVRSAQVFRDKLSLVSPKARVDFGLYGVILPDNESELSGLADAGAMGFKL